MLDILILLIMVVCLIYIIIKEKSKKLVKTLIIVILILFYSIVTFGISPSAKITYNLTNKNNYIYLSNYQIDNGKTIVISRLESAAAAKNYSLSVYNKKLGLYFKNYIKFEKSVILSLENKEFELVYIKFENKYYCLVDFTESSLETLEINDLVIEKQETPYTFFKLEESINSIKIDGFSPNWFSVPIPF